MPSVVSPCRARSSASLAQPTRPGQALSSWLVAGLAVVGLCLLVLPPATRVRLRGGGATASALDELEARRRHETVFALAAEPLPALVRITGDTRCGDAEMGTDLVAKSTGAYGLEGPPDNVDPHFARAGQGPKLPAPTARFGRQAALGTDAQNALGRMWGDKPGNQAGEKGLGRRGTPGGVFKSIEIAPAFAAASGELRVVHTGLRVSGSRKPSEVGRAMAARFDDFRRCGAEASSSAAQLVELEFAIGADGHASASSLPATPLEACLARTLSRLTFSAQSGAVSRVVYPLHFLPGSAGLPSSHSANSGAAEACECGG